MREFLWAAGIFIFWAGIALWLEPPSHIETVHVMDDWSNVRP
jgi:hypothetical protein